MIEQLGPYQIQEQISKGGMGTIYKAYHPALDRHVAIKVLASRFSADPHFVERFKKEAQIVARLEHPHILPIYDFAHDGETAYIVMKLVEGSSLYAHIGPRGMPPDEALTVLEAAAQGLAHAHKRNIVHRDIKPDNILIDEGGWVYLTDFGMAKMVTSTGPTAEGTILGTPEYMAPEQAQGKIVDHRADIYSLTVLIFHVLTGSVPFKGAHPLATIKQVIYDPFPEITSRNPNLPKLLDPLLAKGAAKNPDERFYDVMELVKMLGAVLASASLPATKELFIRKFRLAVLPFYCATPDKAWLAEGVQEMLNMELSQCLELSVLSGDQVLRMCRNVTPPDSKWSPDTLQRFFELSRTDYAILGRISENRIDYQIKISTTFQTVDEGFVEGTIPFHLVSTIAQRIKTRLEIKETKGTSVEQIFRGNVSLLQQYAIGVHAFRNGKYAEADRALRLALKFEPNFSPALIYLARTQQERGLRDQAKESAQSGVFQVSDLPYSLASLIKAQYYGFVQKHEEAAEIYHEFHNQFPDVTEYLVWWGEALVKADRLEEAANVFYEICEKESKSGLGWLRLAWIEFLQEKYEQAWYHYKRAQKLYQSLNHFGGLAATYMGVAQVSEKRGDWNAAVDYYQRAVEAFTKINWPKGIAKAKYHLALSLRKQSSYSAVLMLLRESLSLFHDLGDLYGEFLCLRQMLSEPLEIAEALDLSDRVLVTASEIQDDKLTASVIPLKMRWLVESKHPDAVLRVYSSYYNLLVLGSPDLHFPLSQIQVTRALIQQQRFPEAHQHIEQAIRILGKTNNPYLVVRGMLVRCELFLLEGKKQQAQDYVDATGLIAEKLSDRELALDVEIMRGRILEAEGDRVQLLQVYLNALRLAEDLNNTTQIRSIKGQIEQLRAMKTQS